MESSEILDYNCSLRVICAFGKPLGSMENENSQDKLKSSKTTRPALHASSLPLLKDIKTCFRGILASCCYFE